jgi:hypothetical protein
VTAWLLVDQLSGTGASHPLPWRNLTAETGRLELPRGITREFISEQQLAAYLHSRGGTHVPRVDFPRTRAALITLGPRSTTAYAIRVLRVREGNDNVVVTIRRQNASIARPGTPRLTFPYQLIALPTTGKRIHVEWVAAE